VTAGGLSLSPLLQRQPGEDGQVGMKLDTLKTAHSERGKAVIMLQPSELSLNGGASPVEVF
jgi:hypothetical protein